MDERSMAEQRSLVERRLFGSSLDASSVQLLTSVSGVEPRGTRRQSGTLLGPEGSSNRSSPGHPHRELPLGHAGWQARVRGWNRPLLENYTVDASIFSSK